MNRSPDCVEVQNASGRDDIPAPESFRRWVSAALDDRCPGDLVSIRIVDEAESESLNSRYRAKDGPTNVLTFPAELPNVVGDKLLGDLVICAPVVAREATEQGKPGAAHWAHMVVHGVFHLLGYDHETDEKARTMESLEVATLGKLGFPDPYETA